jgi:hypothetical protein
MSTDTWRDSANLWTRAAREHTRRWLRFCESLGHVLSPIERAVVNDAVYIPDDLAPHPMSTDSTDDADFDGPEVADDQPQGEADLDPGQGDDEDEDKRDQTGSVDQGGRAGTESAAA